MFLKEQVLDIQAVWWGLQIHCSMKTLLGPTPNVNLSPEVHGRAQTQHGDQPSSNQIRFCLLHGVPKQHRRSQIKGVDSEVHLCLHISKIPRSLFTAQQQFLPWFCTFFNLCCCEHVAEEKKILSGKRKKFQTQNGIANMSCHVSYNTNASQYQYSLSLFFLWLHFDDFLCNLWISPISILFKLGYYVTLSIP